MSTFNSACVMLFLAWFTDAAELVLLKRKKTIKLLKPDKSSIFFSHMETHKTGHMTS